MNSHDVINFKKRILENQRVCFQIRKDIAWLQTKALYEKAVFDQSYKCPSEKDLGLLQKPRKITTAPSSKKELEIVYEDDYDEANENLLSNIASKIQDKLKETQKLNENLQINP